MATKKQFTIGALILVILTASVYIFLPENVKLEVTGTYTTFKVWENNSWILAGTEYTKIYEGSTQLKANSRIINYTMSSDNISTITRTALFNDNITVIDIYTFNGNTKDVELFPVSHQIKILNAKDKILQYEVSNLLYTGQTVKDIESPQSFGHKMKLEWQDGNYYSQLYKYSGKNVGKVTVKYKIDSDDYNINVRLFDPIVNTWCYQESANVSTVCGGLATGSYPLVDNYNMIDENWSTSFTISANDGISVYYYKPSGAVNTSLLQFKTASETSNISIPIGCWNYNANWIFIFVTGEEQGGNWYFHLYCQDGIGSYPSFYNTMSSTFYEEAMWWNMTEIILPNVSIQSPINNTIYSTNSIDLNWTVDITPSWCAYSLDGGTNNTAINNGTSSSEICYQETANVSTSCGGLSTGRYNWTGDYFTNYEPSNATDGNWNTFSMVLAAGGEHVLEHYINYSKPANVLNSSLWQYHISSYQNVANTSLPITCWNQNPLQFQVILNDDDDSSICPGDGVFCSKASCWNGTDWHILDDYDEKVLSWEATFYEESMWWNLTKGPTNITLTSLSEGNHNVTIYCNDTSGIIGQSAYTYFTVDTSAPIWTVIPANKTLNYSQAFGVGFTATDSLGISTYFVNDTTRFQINSSGWLSNKTILAANDHYHINVSVNDTLNNINSTIYHLNVTKQEPTVGITITGISGEYPDEITIEAYSQDRYTGEEDVMVMNLFINGTSVINPYTVTLAAGDYNITYNGTINENYTSASLYYYGVYTQDPNTGNCDMLFNKTSPLIEGSSFKAYTNCNSAFQLLRNGTIIANNSDQTLVAGNYNFTVYRNDTQNYTYISDTEIFAITSNDPDTKVEFTCGHTKVQFRINGSNLVQNGIEPVGQNLTCPAYNITNNGTGDGDYLKVKLNQSLIPGISFLCNTSYSIGTGLNLTTTFQDLYTGTITAGTSKNVYCWIDVNNPTSGKLGKVIFNITK